MNILADLQKWYESQCNDDWEDQFGVEIDTIDNPGWTVTIDLNDTNLAGKPFVEIKDIEPERDWIHCWIEDTKFRGAGGPQKLEEILRVFLNWANSV